MEPNFFFLEIISAYSSEKIKVQWVEVESPTGSFFVGYDHCPLVSLIKQKSKFSYKSYEGKEVVRDVFGGVFRIAGNRAVALLRE